MAGGTCGLSVAQLALSPLVLSFCCLLFRPLLRYRPVWTLLGESRRLAAAAEGPIPARPLWSVASYFDLSKAQLFRRKVVAGGLAPKKHRRATSVLFPHHHTT